MPGRYGARERSSKRYSGPVRPRSPRILRFIGIVLGVSLVTGGVVAVVSAGDTPDSHKVMSDEQVSPDQDTGLLARDRDEVSRSDTRQPGRRVHSLPTSLSTRTDHENEPDSPRASASPTGDDKPKATVRPDQPTTTPKPDPTTKPEVTAALPENSGQGRRIVYDITQQQVWLVEDDNEVARTYPVSGSRDDDLVPAGTYEVFSKSREAISWDYESTMRYMVRFHRGENSNIGFHDIPIYDDSGKPAQTLSELGTPLSDGCVRQARGDAEALWDFAPVGTTVVVVRT